MKKTKKASPRLEPKVHQPRAEVRLRREKVKKVVKEIKKRDGNIVPFDKEKIVNAVFRAMTSLGMSNIERARAYAESALKKLESAVKPKEIPTVEKVQDVIEKTLIEEGEVRLVRAYMTYRDERLAVRREKEQILEKDAVDEVDKFFDANALRVLKSRYLAKDEEGHLIESPKQLFERVAVHTYLPSFLYEKNIFDKSGKSKIQPIESFDPVKSEGKVKIGKYVLNKYNLEALKTLYDRLSSEGKMKVSWSRVWKALQSSTYKDHEKGIDRLYNLMRYKRFLPNTPALANFGRKLGMGSACFVLDIDDSLGGIMGTLQSAAFIFQAGGGLGYNFSKLRPEGDIVRSTSGIASGPISFMSLFDKMTDVIKQGGIRRGANMGIMNSNHPDIEKFITAKKGNKALRNFNISVILMDDFWQYYKKDEDYPLINPRSGKVMRKINARTLFDIIVYQAWESAEPGLIFYDRINEHNPFLKELGPILATNPCGEVLLYPNESCNLGSMNVYAFVRRDPETGKTSFDWEGLGKAVHEATEFLDNVIDVNKFPLPQIEGMSLKTRKIGLGIMGLADALFALRVSYDSKEGQAFMERLMEFINFESKMASSELARIRGSFPYYKKSFYPQGKLPFAGFYDKKSWNCDWKKVSGLIKRHGLRNAYTTVIAPTGSISMIAGASSGIEPAFSLVFEKNVAVGSFYYINEEFGVAMREFGIYDEELLKEITTRHGSVEKISYLPPLVKKVFRVAHDLTPEDHIRALAVFQKWVDSSISKTINFHSDATIEDMKKTYLLGYELGCKGVTVYRDGSIENQVLNAPGDKKDKQKQENPENGNGNGTLGPLVKCPKCGTTLVRGEGCLKCPSCGWGLCT